MLLRRLKWPTIAWAILLSGCATVPHGDHAAPLAHELSAVPFNPQKIHQCGPAALATVLEAAGQSVTPDELTPQVYVPGRKGSFGPEMIAAAREHGMVPVPVHELSMMKAAIDDGTPVLVFQNLAVSWLPVWHYAVVIGYDDARKLVLQRSGTNPRRIDSMKVFEHTWDLGHRWAYVMAPPDRIPAVATAKDWIQSVSAIEELGKVDEAEKAYRAATVRWPEQSMPWFALSNIQLGKGETLAAETSLQHAAEHDPSVPVLNNLASLQIERGCRAEALATLSRLHDVPTAFKAAVADTERSAQALPEDSVCR